MLCFIHMDSISLAAETFLQLLEQEFATEIANHQIHSEHVKYSSASDARMAMLRQAYLRGRHDATAAPADFDADVRRVEEANAANR